MSASTAATMTATGRQAAQPHAALEPNAVLEARDLRKVYSGGSVSITVLAGVNLTLLAGEMVAVVGPSGSGKSTLLHLLAALDTPTSGAVYFAAHPLAALQDSALADFRNRSVGFVWQRHCLLPDFTAAENIAMPLLIEGGRRDEALAAAAGWLGEVGLATRSDHRAGELSGGEQQRVAIARALVNRPKILLADEPTGNLDEHNAEDIFRLMQRLHRAHGLSSVLATHNITLARRCDRILRLEHGLLAELSASPEGNPALSEGESS